MNRNLALACVLVLSSFVLAQNSAPGTSSAGQQTAPAAAPQSAQLQPGSLIYAELSKSIDSKKAKAGDPVLAKVTQAVLSRGKIAIPKNTKVMGHLTAAKARTKDQPQSELGIAFDRAELKDGTQIPLSSVMIQALAGVVGFDQTPSNVAGGAETSGMPSGRPGANMGGMNTPMGASPYPANTGSGGVDTPGGTEPSPSAGSVRLNAGSRGVVGMSGVRLQPQPQGGTVAADGKNVKLDSGTQLVLRVP